MLTGLVLLYVGAVLILNGIWLSGRIADREIVLINLVVAAISAGVAIATAIGATGIEGVRAAAMTLLFAITYLWVAYNRLSGCDGRGLGWFSLFVAVTVLPVAGRELATADSFLSFWLGLNWVVWSGLWLLYFVGLALGRPVAGLTARATLITGVITGWLPGLLMLHGVLR
jgi:hypothetical protein